MIKKILWVLLLALVIIQFIHPKRNKAEGPQPHYIGQSFEVPATVKEVLSRSCMDCHSNNTDYPWYARFQPVHWWLNNHIREGKAGLNFDEYTNKSLRYQYHKMEETVEMIEEEHMPLESYTWTHKDARLTDNERSMLINWAKGIMVTMESKYPMDSLVRKK
jgi:hypothetical protein